MDAVTAGAPEASRTTANSAQPQAPPSIDGGNKPRPAWFLGLDIGTSGLSAALVNQTTEQLIPVFWQQAESSQYWFRWPIDRVAEPANEGFAPSAADPTAKAAVLCQLKSALALPLRRDMAGTVEHSAEFEPAYRPLTHILEPLNPNRSTAPTANQPWTCGGLDLDEMQFAAAMGQLCGIGVSYPAGWPDRYRTNIQNAILEAGLISQPSAIYAVEEAIAAATACLQSPNNGSDGNGDGGSPSASPPRLRSRLPYTVDPEGVAFVLNAGASTTELALVNLTALAQGKPSVLASRTLAYAGQALDQDLLVHHLYPQLQGSSSTDVEQVLHQLQLDHVDQPQLGQPDVIKRLRLHLRLCSSVPGQQLLAIAQQIKHDLQTLPQSRYTIAQHHGHVTQDAFGHHILLPYIRSLTQQVQSLVEQTALSPQSARYIICSGGTATMRVIHLWVRQCFPEADLLFSPSIERLEATELETMSSAWLGSQVGYGLARLPLFFQSAAESTENTI
ncbi:MAG: hypothetical protein WBA10_17550 [Elainellaceae cyanobacterium]